jgi:hypothetical protein
MVIICSSFFYRKNVHIRAQILMCLSSPQLFYSFTVEHNKKRNFSFDLLLVNFDFTNPLELEQTLSYVFVQEH